MRCLRFRAHLLLPALAIGFLVASDGRAAAPTGGGPSDAQRLIFLLEYIGTDYDGAVRDGAVVSQAEYGEVLRFTKQLIQGYGAHPGRSSTLVSGLRELEQLIVRRAPSDEVWATTRRLLPDLARTLGGAARPEQPPNLADGRRLWADDCAPCHGMTGAGDGPASPDMEPPPTAFRGEWLERLSPHQVFNAVSLGVAGTAMPSFEAYSEAQRWDVAFFAMTLRVDFDPKRPEGDTRFTLEKLAASSNVELLARLRDGRPEASPHEVDYVRVNFLAPTTASDTVPSGLTVALQMQDAFASVAERILPRVVGVSSYVRDPQWLAQKLQAERGDAWMAANPDLLRYPGFRPVRSGTGFIIDDEGWVLSCDHLIRDDRGEVVQLVDVEVQGQAHYASTVVGTEPTLDLAVLRVPELPRAPDVAPLEAGDSDRLQVGHWLIALGDPPGPERAFAVGVVSAPAERQCYQAQITATRLQSSLVVPAAGLGGPVVDIFGHLVGMSVHQTSSAGAAVPGETASAAQILPVNLVLNLYEALKVAKSQRSPWIGVSVLELTTLRQRLESQTRPIVVPPDGLYLDDVFAPSPASRAGVRPGDFLLGLGGHKLSSVGDFQRWLYVLGIGAQVELELLRDGKPVRASVPIEERPESATTR